MELPFRNKKERAEAQLEEARDKLRAKAVKYNLLFSSDLGKEVLADLSQEFDLSPDKIVTPGDPYSTHFKLGRKDPIDYIKSLIRVGAQQ